MAKWLYERERMQKYLPYIRWMFGVSRQNLAEELEGSPETIRHLESRTRKITTVQYLAFRSVFQYKIEDLLSQPDRRKDGLILRDIFKILVDQGDDFLGEKDEICSIIEETKQYYGIAKYCHSKQYPRIAAEIRKELRLWQLSNS